MAWSGQRLENPATGECIVFRKTASETNGEFLEVDFFWPPGFDRGEAHIHPEMEERFEVLKGRARVRVAGEDITAGPGDVIVVPPGLPHISSNAGDEIVHVRARFCPALHQEAFIESLYRVARRKGTSYGVVREMLQRALLAHTYRREVRPVRPPMFVQRILFPVLSVVAWLFGHRV